ncbi:MAG: C39 family peptidase [Polyangiaceae bacterium]|nr:C39 family peptidase [Polyangiaceae bacterium]
MSSAPVGGAGPWSGGGGSPAPGGPGGDPAGVGPPPGGVDLPAPADDWTRARQIFSGIIEGVGEAAVGTAGQVAKNALYTLPIAGQVLLAYDVYESAERHGGGLGGAFVGLNEMFNPAYGAISAGVDAYDALQAGDDRKLGNRLFHLGAGILATAALVEGGPGGLKTGPAAEAGAGVPWKAIGERPSPAVVRQNYPNACAPACAASILREVGGDLKKVTQEQVMEAAGQRYNPHGGMQARDLANVLNEMDPRVDKSWRADQYRGTDPAEAVRDLSADGPWIACTAQHMVVVDGLDAAGNVIIRDPAGGAIYTTTLGDFARYWTGYFVGRW